MKPISAIGMGAGGGEKKGALLGFSDATCKVSYVLAHATTLQVNPACIFETRPFIIGIVYLIVSYFVIVPNGTPCKPQ